jgi:hypothetical protein
VAEEVKHQHPASLIEIALLLGSPGLPPGASGWRESDSE